MRALRVAGQAARLCARGGPAYWAWVGTLAVLVIGGAFAWARQLDQGLVVTAMRDPVSWGFYIGNFTFLVGVAAASVLLVIPAYVYDWKPIKEVVLLGELLAICALVMAMLFVLADVGRPERVWRMMPGIGTLNLPSSLLAWDVVVLSLYLAVNVVIAGHVLWRASAGRTALAPWAPALILASIPLAVAIHTVTAFVYNGLPARPFWNASILAPRFIASAFCSGPAILLVVFQILRARARFDIKDEAIWKVAELMAYAMALNLFLLGAEVFKEAYSGTRHVAHMKYLYVGLDGHAALVPYAWASVLFSVTAFLLFLVPASRRNPVTLNLGCLLIYAGVYIDKGIGLVMPGFAPGTLGEIYDYVPTWTEVRVAAGIFSFGLLAFTLMVKVALPVMLGERARPS
jgi:molybdopterin-containing oxidoreductase family membrane subunit